MLDGHIGRKIVKQTVMTSVYGVTFIGARTQIQNRLEEVPALAECTEAEWRQQATYLATLTLASLGQVIGAAARPPAPPHAPPPTPPPSLGQVSGAAARPPAPPLTPPPHPRLRQVFTGAVTSMNWLAECARVVSCDAGQPVEWLTPLGLPVVQVKPPRVFPAVFPPRDRLPIAVAMY